MVHHAIDVMHVEKNVWEALVSTLLDIPSKIKDTLKARMDLEEMKLRKDIHHETLEKKILRNQVVVGLICDE